MQINMIVIRGRSEGKFKLENVQSDKVKYTQYEGYAMLGGLRTQRGNI